jgi:uncharacterized protein (TIGR02145 family)
MEWKVIKTEKECPYYSKYLISLILISTLIGFSLFGCEKDNGIEYQQPFTDSEGNEYPTARLCDGKIWMLKNLSISTFRNGNPIPYIYHENWKDFNDYSPAQCIVLDSFELESEYGRLYNWYAVSDPRGLAPAGWHVPTLAEWQALIDCNGGNEFAGDRLKEAGIAHWKSGKGNNQSGLNALPGGRRISIPDENLGELATFRTGEPNNECNGFTTTPYYGTHDSGPGAYTNCGNNNVGASVRCIKNE